MRSLTSVVRAEASGDYGLGPIEIFDFFLPSQTLHFTNYDKSISFFGPTGDAVTYTPFPIQREQKQSSSDMAIDSVVIRAQNVDLAMSAYLATDDFRGRRVVVRKMFPQYTANSGDAVLVVDGFIEQIAADQQALQCEVVPKALGTLRAEGPRRWYQVLCNWKFGEPGTCASGDDHSRTLFSATAGTVGAGSTIGRILDSGRTEGGGKTGNGFWVEGTLEFVSGVHQGALRKVIKSGVGYLDLDFAISPVPSGDGYVVRKGCDKSLFRCSGDHVNQANFGGFSTIPQQEVIR